MNNQFKPGDLALLIKNLAHIGAGTVVELVDLIEKGEIVTNQDCTQINVAKARGWICKCPLGTLAVAEKESHAPASGLCDLARARTGGSSMSRYLILAAACLGTLAMLGLNLILRHGATLCL